MHPIINPAAYISKEFFLRDLELMRTNWHFAGFVFEILNHDDFLTTRIGEVDLVLQNFKGSIAAFTNVCSHRFSQIQTQPEGNRSLRCPYHGWAYGFDGIPVGVPQKGSFPELADPVCREKFKLEQWEVDTCGQLIFVRQKFGGLTLREFLGEIYDRVENMTSAFGERIDKNSFVIQANWKVAVENTLECYHCAEVHPDSFANFIVIGNDIRDEKLHSSWHTAISERYASGLGRVEKIFASRPVNIAGYFHQLIFPNLTLVTTNGLTYHLQIFDPVSPHETLFISHSFLTKLSPQVSINPEIKRGLVASSIDFNRRVFEEDRVICETVQKGLRFPPVGAAGILADDEVRIQWFQQQVVSSAAFNAVI